MPKGGERAALESTIREGARKLCLSNDTMGWFLEWATPRQLHAVASLIGHELSVREKNKKTRLLRKATFPAMKSIDSFDFSDVKLPEGHTVEDMRALEWVSRAEDYVFYGQTGRGKTHLAIAIGMLCIEAGMSVRYLPCAQLVLSLLKVKEEGRLEAALADISKADLLILDEFGYIPLDCQGAKLLFQVISTSYERRSVILTTNIEFSRWTAALADEKLAAAAVNRIIHHGRLVEFSGESRRVQDSLMLGNAVEGK